MSSSNPRTPVKITSALLLATGMFLLQACGSSTEEPPNGGAAEPFRMTTDVPEDGSGETGEEYSFTLTYDSNANTPGGDLSTADSSESVTFRWTFGDGSYDENDGTHQTSATVELEDGIAEHTVTHTYSLLGRFSFVAAVENEDGEVLHTYDYPVPLGSPTADFEVLAACGSWQPAGEEGENGVTITDWDISTVADGSEFDFRYDAVTIPDKFVIEYPVGNEILNTGWRGDASYAGNPLFPGGIAGTGEDTESNLFSKTSGDDEFRVIVYGPDPATIWEYEVQCH